MSEPPLTSSWCTAWGSFNTPRLWAMVADEDNPDAWRQVAAWGDVATSVKDQRSRLVAAKAALIAAWPPSQNASADAFVTELDDLLSRMDRAHQDANATADGYANILEALRQAKNQVQPLYEEYKQKNDDWVPGWFDNAEDEIDEKARKALIAAEQAVEQNVPSIKVPEPYKMDPNAMSGYTPPKENTAGDGTRYSGGVGSTHATTSSSSGGGRDGEIPVPHEPVPPMPGMDPIDPSDGSGGGGGSGPGGPGAGVPGSGVPGGGGSGGGGGGTGPDLAGVTPLPVPPPLPTPPPGVPPIIGQPLPPAPPPTILPPPILGVPPTVTGIGGGPGGPGGAGKPPPTAPFGRSGGRGALPSGAVIGETVGRSGNARPGGVAAGNVGRSATAPGRANSPTARSGQKPPRPSWLPPDEHAGTRGATSQTAMSGARRGNQQGDEPEGKRFDPDNPWEVESGVAPVIKPQTGTPRHDPGPNVIGGYRG